MKWFFIILLVANLVYLGWELDRQTTMDRAQDSEALVVPPHVSKLVLLRELPQPPLARKQQEDMAQGKNTSTKDTAGAGIARESTGSPADVRVEERFMQDLVTQLPDIRVSELKENPQAAADMCFSFGPFPDVRETKDLLAWFDERHVSVQQRPEKDKENQLFWIYLAPQDSLGGAMQAIADLKKKGIKDYRLIETGDLRNAISLGLFSTQASVNRRLNELKDKGYRPIVVPYRAANIIYWVDVKLVNQQNILNQMFTDYPAHYNSVPIACSEIAMSRDTP